jgi:cytochrome c
LAVDTLRRRRLNGCGPNLRPSGSVADVAERRTGTKGKGRMMTKTLIVAVALIATSTEAGMAQDVAKGEISFKKCVICHSIGPGAQNKVGPAQNGLDGRKAGSVPNYQYSDANKNSGIVWNEATFKEYIKDPKAKIPGTKMVFAGIKNDQEINDLWAYLKQFDANGNIKK